MNNSTHHLRSLSLDSNCAEEVCVHISHLCLLFTCCCCLLSLLSSMRRSRNQCWTTLLSQLISCVTPQSSWFVCCLFVCLQADRGCFICCLLVCLLVYSLCRYNTPNRIRLSRSSRTMSSYTTPDPILPSQTSTVWRGVPLVPSLPRRTISTLSTPLWELCPLMGLSRTLTLPISLSSPLPPTSRGELFTSYS